MADKREYNINIPAWEAEAILRNAAEQAGKDNPEVQKLVAEKKKKAQEEAAKAKISDEARAEAGNKESPRDKFNRVLSGRTIDEDIEAGKFPELFKPKK